MSEVFSFVDRPTYVLAAEEPPAHLILLFSRSAARCNIRCSYDSSMSGISVFNPLQHWGGKTWCWHTFQLFPSCSLVLSLYYVVYDCRMATASFCSTGTLVGDGLHMATMHTPPPRPPTSQRN